jgi:hypothetical protein
VAADFQACRLVIFLFTFIAENSPGLVAGIISVLKD